MRFIFHEDNNRLVEPFEYFCKNCKTMHLSFVALDKCSDCNSTDIVKGKPYELDKEQLLRDAGILNG